MASIDDREPLPNPMVDAMVLPQEEGKGALPARDVPGMRSALRDTLNASQVFGISQQQRPTSPSQPKSRDRRVVELCLVWQAAARPLGDAAVDAVRTQLVDPFINLWDSEGDTPWTLTPTAHV